MLSFDWTGPGPSGWPKALMMYQPDLEQTLADAASTSAHITVLRGHEAVSLTEHPDHVEVTSQAQDGTRHTVSGSYVVGCDGANSFVRGYLPHGTTDLGFFYDWLIVDVRPHEHRAWNPVNLQLCDPRRPTTVVSGGPGRRRWEFMRMPGETIDELNTEETTWRLLADWDLNPGNCDLERHAVYTFQARWADTWRAGRLLLAGDAAHLMPPFAGQGMGSGIRDAANLGWKLSLVLDGHADAALLDTYGTERAAHIQHAIGMSVELGKVICVTDPAAAARRDAHMISQGADPAKILPPLPPPRLTSGVLHGPGSGRLSTQARVRRQATTGLLDDVVGGRFVVAATADPRTFLTERQLAFLDAVGTSFVRFVEPGTSPLGDIDTEDIDHVYLPHFAEAGHGAAVVRPDHYVFGTAIQLGGLGAVIDELQRQLSARKAAGEPARPTGGSSTWESSHQATVRPGGQNSAKPADERHDS
ncbi:bifunctional 3-(3-hydroxy-phenyl)propionate/3-hydroxycinnamic acid hydroxylase [Streptomyces indonesiensis]